MKFENLSTAVYSRPWWFICIKNAASKSGSSETWDLANLIEPNYKDGATICDWYITNLKLAFGIPEEHAKRDAIVNLIAVDGTNRVAYLRLLPSLDKLELEVLSSEVPLEEFETIAISFKRKLCFDETWPEHLRDI